ncbi:MAG: hypothetical protein Q9195_009032 [Heterodermia aff. obscurata]
MASPLKPILLHSHPGPNPWKIALLLSELDVPYSTHVYSTQELKTQEFLAINPTGMAPVIEDPNTGIVLAESSAIADYILTQYDTAHSLSFADLEPHFQMRQWLAYQVTTQGPWLQQIFRWSILHSNPEAKAAYVADFRRVLQVLDDHLEGRQWLVGDKCSAADLSFVSFHSRLGFIMREDVPDVEKEFPSVDAWYKRMLEREAVKKVMREHDESLKKFVPPPKKE